MPDLAVSTAAAIATDQLHPALTPVTSPTMILFLTTLPASKAAGVAAIRMSRVNGDFQLEELDEQGDTIIGLVLHIVVDTSTQKVTGIAVTQMGSSATPSPFTPAQLSAFSLITNELKQFQASLPASANVPAAKTPLPKGVKRESSILSGIMFVLSCGAAAVEGGGNPIADAECIVNAGEALSDDSDEGTPDPAMQNLLNTMQQVANTPLPTPQGSSGQPQGDGSGGDDNGTVPGDGDDVGGGGSGEGPDGKPGIQPD
jgi:hypothetical protein